MLRKPELSFYRTMTLETRTRVFARIDDEFGTPASAGDMETSRAVARFAAGLAYGSRILQMYPRMSAAGEDTANVRVALGTSSLTHEMGTRNIGSRRQAQRCCRTRNEYQSHARSQAQGSGGGQVSFRFYDRRLASHRLCE
jgi:hypothetical protein